MKKPRLLSFSLDRLAMVVRGDMMIYAKRRPFKILLWSDHVDSHVDINMLHMSGLSHPHMGVCTDLNVIREFTVSVDVSNHQMRAIMVSLWTRYFHPP